MGYIFLYLFSLALSKAVSAFMNNREKCFFVNNIFNEGHKINHDYLDEIMDKYKKKANVISFIPVLCIFQSRIRSTKLFAKVRKDPAFVSNLVETDLSDREFVEKKVPDFLWKYDKMSEVNLHELVERTLAIMAIFDITSTVTNSIDFGVREDDELNINEDGSLSKDVIDKMVLAQKTYEQEELNKKFYMLTDSYTLSEVYKIDENPIFVSKDNVIKLAFINATVEEVKEFSKKGFIVKPSLDCEYHVISFKPFDKNKLRKSLLEIEYFKNSIDQVLDMEEEKSSKKEKRKIL